MIRWLVPFIHSTGSSSTLPKLLLVLFVAGFHLCFQLEDLREIFASGLEYFLGRLDNRRDLSVVNKLPTHEIHLIFQLGQQPSDPCRPRLFRHCPKGVQDGDNGFLIVLVSTLHPLLLLLLCHHRRLSESRSTARCCCCGICRNSSSSRSFPVGGYDDGDGWPFLVVALALRDKLGFVVTDDSSITLVLFHLVSS